MSNAPALRARPAASAPIRPVQTGTASLLSVQIAAMPIVPAPMKRTCSRQYLVACVAASTSGIGCIVVSTGTSTPHAITRPVSMARPTVRPTRCPAPSRASEEPAPMPVDPTPTLKKLVTSAANTRAATAAA